MEGPPSVGLSTATFATATSANVKAGLYKLNGFNDNGLTPSLTFKPGKSTTIKCFVLWGIKNGKFVLPKGDHYVCQP